MISEFTFIESLREKAHIGQGVVLGIGDDCAALRAMAPNRDLLATSDLMTEGVHFDLAWGHPECLGRKSVAVNVSDIAAMGGFPVALLWSLAIPARHFEFLAALTRGVEESCKEFGISLVGGDTSSAKNDLTLSHTLLGEVEKGKMVRRSGAREGDVIFCSGRLGDAALGLRVFQKEIEAKKLTSLERDLVVQRFLNPQPRLDLGQKLAHTGVTSMIDVSDGLLQDLGHILKASRVSAWMDPAAIPLSEAVRASGLSVMDACTAGEDYELLFTAPPELAPKILALGSLQVPVTRIGEIRAGGQAVGQVLSPGQPWPTKRRGFEHF